MKQPPAPTPSPSRQAHAREAHPLLSAFPLTVMTLATALVLFALTMTWFKAGEDSPLHPSTETSQLTTNTGVAPVRTLTPGVGRPARAKGPLTTSQASSQTRPAIVTRTPSER